MACKYFTGWETGDSLEAQATAGTFSVQSAVKRTGGYALRVNPTTTGTGSHTIKGLAADGTFAGLSTADLYGRVYFRYATKPASGQEIVLVVQDTVPTSKLVLYLNSAGNIVAKNGIGGVTLGTGATALAADTWYRIEWRCGTGVAANYEVKINGISEISGTATFSVINTDAVLLGKSADDSGQTVDFFYDDLSLSDSAYPGAGQCELMLPNANGNYNQWTRSLDQVYQGVGAYAVNATTAALTIVAPLCNADDILIAHIQGKNNQTVSPPDGTWTLISEGNQSTLQRVSIFWKRASGGDSGASFIFTKPVDDNLFFAGVISAWRGCVTATSPIDATTPSLQATSSNDTVNYATFDPTETTNAYVVAMGTYNNDLTTAGAISGTDPILGNKYDLETTTDTDGSLFCFAGISSGAATGARSHTTTSTNDAGSIGVMFGLVLLNNYEYAHVDDIPSDAGTSTLQSIVIGDATTVDLESASSAGIADTVNCVKSYANVAYLGVSDGSVKVRLRSGSTDDDTDASATVATYAARQKLYATDPADAAAWTIADLDALEVGVVNNSTNGSNVTQLFVMVDFSSAPVAVEPATQTLTVTGFAPVLNQAVRPATKSLTVAGFAPVLKQAVIPATKPLTITTFAPTVMFGQTATPDPVPIVVNVASVPIATITAAPLGQVVAITAPTKIAVALPAPTITVDYTATPDPVAIAIFLPIPDVVPPVNPEGEWKFLHNWQTPLEVTRSWATDITPTLEDRESRRGLVDRPYLTQTQSCEALGPHGHDASLLFQFLRDMSEQNKLVPLLSDFVKLTADHPPGVNTLTVSSTADRRFSVGARVLVLKPYTVHDLGASRTRWYAEDAVLRSIGANDMVIDSSLAASFPRGSRVYPCIQAEYDLDTGTEPWSSLRGRGQVTVSEVPGLSAGAPTQDAGTAPAGLGEYAGLPVLDMRHDWAGMEQGTLRAGSQSKIGLGLLTELYGSRRTVIKVGYKLFTRALAMRLVRFFDGRCGRLHPFWFVEPTKDLRLLDVTYSGAPLVTKLVIDKDFDGLLEEGSTLGIVRKDGAATLIVRVTSIADDGNGDHVCAITGGYGEADISIDNVHRISRALLVRLAADEMRESWITDECMTTTLSMIEVCRSGDAECSPAAPDVDPPDVGGPDLPAWAPCAGCLAIDAILPMWAEPCDSCDSARPLHRSADLGVPPTMSLTFGADWTKDPSHPFAGDLVNAIARLAGTWNLNWLGADYVPAVATSRHWHHMTITNAVPDPAWGYLHLPVAVARYPFEKTLLYSGDDGEQYTMTVRWVPEYAEGDDGCKSTCVHIHVFTTELDPDFEDGDSYEGNLFWKDDPAIWDVSDEFNQRKLCHPQLLGTACIPTTMEAPCGYRPHEPHEAPECFRVTVGTPWSAGGNPAVSDALDNSVFGTQSGVYDQRATMLGAGCPDSEVFDWVCIENGNAEGLTALVPGRSGWNDPEGGLTSAAGSSITQHVCKPEGTASVCCAGHPGGDGYASSRTGALPCWISDSGAFHLCCFSHNMTVQVTITQKCHEIEGVVHRYGASWTREVTMVPKVCSYLDDSDDTEGREFTWYALVPDPDVPDRSSTDDFGDGDLVDWGNAGPYAGTWTEESGVLKAGPGSPGPVPYEIMRTGPAGNMDTIRDVQLYATVGVAAKPYGFCTRMTGEVASESGYIGEYDHTDNHVRIWRADAGTLIFIAQVSLIESQIPAAGDVVSFASAGGVHTFYIKGKEVLSAEDPDGCVYESGYAGIACTVGVEGSEYDDFALVDLSPPQVEISATMGQLGWEFSVPAKAMPGYGLVGACEDDEFVSRFLDPSEILTSEFSEPNRFSLFPYLDIPPPSDCVNGVQLPPFQAFRLEGLVDDELDGCDYGEDDPVNFPDGEPPEEEPCDGAAFWYFTCIDTP